MQITELSAEAASGHLSFATVLSLEMVCHLEGECPGPDLRMHLLPSRVGDPPVELLFTEVRQLQMRLNCTPSDTDRVYVDDIRLDREAKLKRWAHQSSSAVLESANFWILSEAGEMEFQFFSEAIQMVRSTRE